MARKPWLDVLDALEEFAGKWLLIFIGFSFLVFVISTAIPLYVYPGEKRLEELPNLVLIANILFPARLLFDDGVTAIFLSYAMWGAFLTLLFAIRRWPTLRFSLRTLLIAVTLAAVVLGLGVWLAY